MEAKQTQTQSSRLQNPNPRPQIFNPNPNFDFSSNYLSSNKHQEQQKFYWGTMNSLNAGSGGSGARNASEAGGSDYGFAYPSVAQSGIEKPVLRSTSGRSTPRLVKISRKQAPFPKGRSAAVSGSDFNPFRSVSESSNRVDEDGGMQELRDGYQSWKPFASSDSGERINGSYSSASSISGHFEFGKSNGASGFVFGANSSSSTSNPRAENSGIGGGVGASLPQQMQKLNIGNGAGLSAGERVSSSSNDVPEKGAFVFGSSSDKNPSKSAMLVDELRKLNIETPRDRDGIEKNEDADLNSEANDEKTFGFVSRDNAASSVVGNADSKLQDETKSLNVGESGNSGGFDKTEDTSSKVNHKDNFSAFVFGNRKKNYFDSSGGSSAFMPPDEMKKSNVQASVNRDGVEKTEDANFKVNGKNTFIFGSDTNNAGYSVGSNVNKVPNKRDKLYDGSKFVDSGSENIGVAKTENANFKVNEKSAFIFGNDENHAGYFVESNENKLPSRMEKLHIGSKIGVSRGRTDTSSYSSSSRIFSKDRDPGNSTDNVFKDPANTNTINMPTTFQAANSGGSLRVTQDHSTQPNENSKPIGAFASSYSSSSACPTFQTVGEDFEVTSMEGAGKKADPFSTNTAEKFFTHHTDFSTPKQGPSCSTRGNFYAGLNQKSGLSAKTGQTNRTKTKNRRGKSRQPPPVHHWAGQNYVPMENNFEENPESPGHYSPMDFSPYEETLPPDQSSRETSVASEEHFNLDGNCFSKDTYYPSVTGDGPDEYLVGATQNLDINENDFKSGELNEKGARDHLERDVGSTCSFEESFSGAESECLMSETEKVAYGTDASVSVTETEVGFDPNTEMQENDSRAQFCFASLSEDVSDTNFTFAASSSSQGHFSAGKRFHRKKNRMKVGYDSYCSSNVKKQFESSCAQFFPLGSSSLHFGTVQNQMGDSSTCHSIGEKVSEADKNSEVKQRSVSWDSEISASQQACEKWRLRGNQVYAEGNLSKAEEYYTQGVNCVSPNEMSKSCPRALMLCYSNRAVVRMAAGRMREALGDCRKATEIDSEFLKAQIRAANCHLALGEVEDAIDYFKKILPSGDVVCLDRKTAIEASTGIQKAQQMANYLDCCAELLCRKTYKDAESALQIIAEALLISPYSEKLLQMKAEALLVLRKYSELIQLCEQSLEFAEKNSASASDDGQLEKINGSEGVKICSARLWRWCMISKSYFYLGKLEEALEFLEKLGQAVSVAQKYGSKTLESSITLAVTIRELLCHKIAGNEAFQSGRHSEAVEHYTSALSCNVESRPFAAICFCNRAAAYQALGQMTDAIADCSLAIALDGKYPKAISRRATLHEMIRDYGQAVSDLQKLIYLLEKQSEEKANPSGTLSRSTSCMNDLKQAQTRLSAFEEEARKGIPLNMYLILGVEPSGTASEIKKAYRKAALRHHPDKAGQFLARSENGDDGLWKDISEEVHKDADRLFKMIGEAYAVLSDPSKRSRYDLEEESRNAQKKGNVFSSSATPSDAHSYPFERSGSRRQGQEGRRSYKSQSQRSEAYRSNWYS